MEKELPKRKPLRLPEYDYSSTGAYFITICTKDRKTFFSAEYNSFSARTVERNAGKMFVSSSGADSISARMIERTFLETLQQYEGIDSPIFVVMPNHFHAIITVLRADMESAPTVSKIVQAFKRYSTLEYIKMVKERIVPPFDKQIWQRSFFDHVIRNRDDYEEVYKYIRDNPASWQSDQLFVEE